MLERLTGKFNWIAVAIFGFFLSFYLLTFVRTMEYGYADGSVMYHVTQGLVEDGDLQSRVSGYYRGNSKITNSKYGLGFSLASVPGYVFTRWLAGDTDKDTRESYTRRSLMLTNVIVGSLLCLQLYFLLMWLYKNQRLSILLTLVYGLTTLAWTYARSDFSEPLTTLCLISSLYFLLKSLDSTIPYRLLFYSGFCFGFAFLTRPVSFLLLPLFCIPGWQVFKSKDWFKQLLSFIIPLLLFGILALWYNNLRYGAFWVTGYEQDFIRSGLEQRFIDGLYGLLFSFGKGLFWYNPILILAIPGAWVTYRYYPRVTVFSLLVLVVHLSIYSGWWAWEGGWCWGPRNLIPTIPFLMLLVAGWSQYGPGSQTFRHLLIGCLAVLGFGVQFLGNAFPYGEYFQWLSDNGVPYEGIWRDAIYSPLIGHFKFMISISPRLWNYLLLTIYHDSPPVWISLWVFIWGFTLLISLVCLLRAVQQKPSR